ncbi:MAG: glucose 1-dehydrogenase [Planctomycetes bacterium]|nr:glucose 1-dehydrogenase [Planctomycetota bacterium]
MPALLQGKIAIVTGSTRGIGRAIAVAFAAEGANVMVHGTNEQRAAQVAREIEAAGAAAAVCLGDVADKTFAARLVNCAIERFGGVDIFVSNAGMSGFQPFLSMTSEMWQRFLDVHLSGAFYCGQAAAQRMVAQGRGGRILNMSSVASAFALYGFTAYSTVKAALVSLTRVQAVELAEHRITANALVPGPVKNEMMDELWGPEKLAERCKTIPQNRLASPEDVARAAVFFASPAAEYITGQSCVIDGGASAAGLYAHEVFKHFSGTQ